MVTRLLINIKHLFNRFDFFLIYNGAIFCTIVMLKSLTLLLLAKPKVCLNVWEVWKNYIKAHPYMEVVASTLILFPFESSHVN